MRKSWLFIIALVTLGFLAGTIGAGAFVLSGKHGVGEIAAACASAGGTFIPQGLGGDYGCTKSCGDGGTCEVFCDKEGICEGSCPACGERRQRPRARPNRTRLGGADVVTRILNNLTTTRAGGPGYGYGPGPYPDAVIVNPVTGRWCRTESNGYQICWTP
jgi:hypothetical protein